MVRLDQSLATHCQKLQYHIEFIYQEGYPPDEQTESKPKIGTARTWEGRTITVTSLENLLLLQTVKISQDGSTWENLQAVDWGNIRQVTLMENPWLEDQFASPFPVPVQITLTDGSKLETQALSTTGHVEGNFEDGMHVQYMLTALQEIGLEQ